jgi:polyphosphate kinase 2 (PPK2 family)
LLERLDDPAKRWKLSMNDVAERQLWDRYMEAYDEMIRKTSTPDAPWYVVPADRKWFAHLVVAKVAIDTLGRLDLKFPDVGQTALRELEEMRQALLKLR